MGQPEPAVHARSDDAWSRLRLGLLVLEGYAYLVVIVAFMAAMVAWLAWGVATFRPFVAILALFIGIPITLATAAAIRSLFFRLPDAEGVIVARTDAPALHAMIDSVRQELRAPAVHAVRVSGHFNASALQQPRLAVFWPRNTLLLGYPLFATLSSDQLRAVVAHELGHLSRAHGRFAVWVRRVRLSWARLMRELRAREATPAYASWLFRWYLPRLHAHSGTIARRQEILADRCAADIAGARAGGEALIALAVGGAFFEDDFWDEIGSRVESEPEPPRPYAMLHQDFWQRTAKQAEQVLAGLLEQPIHPHDTHPSLAERLSGIGQTPHLPGRPERTAAEEYLGSHAAAVCAVLDTEWQNVHALEWRERHGAVRQRAERVRVLNAVESPTAAELFERGQLVESDSTDAALADYERAAKLGHLGASLAIGRILLDRDESTGIDLIERAMAADPALVPEGCNDLIAFYRRHNRLADMHRWQQRSTAHATRTRMADTERQQVSAFDRFLPHGRTDPELARLAARLRQQPNVTHGFVARRELRYSSGTQFVLALDLRGGTPEDISAGIRAESLVPADAAIVVLGRHDESLRAALAAVPDAKLL